MVLEPSSNSFHLLFFESLLWSQTLVALLACVVASAAAAIIARLSADCQSTMMARHLACRCRCHYSLPLPETPNGS
jgi:hypothetical protein